MRELKSVAECTEACQREANRRRSDEWPPIWSLATRAYFHSILPMSTPRRGGSDIAEHLRAWLEPREDEMAALLEGLVSVPTENPPGRNYRACTDLLENNLCQAGLTCDRHVFPASLASAGKGGREYVPIASEACLTKVVLQQIRASSIISSRWIFRGDADQPFQQRGHLVFARLQPRSQVLSDVGTAATWGTHRQDAMEICASRQAPNWRPFVAAPPICLALTGLRALRYAFQFAHPAISLRAASVTRFRRPEPNWTNRRMAEEKLPTRSQDFS